MSIDLKLIPILFMIKYKKYSLIRHYNKYDCTYLYGIKDIIFIE